ncbi:transferase activity protein [[Candida] boidinii]|nr:transferase activity protein [[Candida] boidinii]
MGDDKAKKGILTSTFLYIFSLGLNNIPPQFWSILWFSLDIILFWFKKIVVFINQRRNTALNEFKDDLKQSNNYSDWFDIGSQIDKITGNDLWRINIISRKFDYRLINERVDELRQAREDNDYLKLISLLRSGLIRNYGGITNKDLYNRSYSGTKFLIEEYIEEVLLCLNFINNFKPNKNDNKFSISNFNQSKLDFFHDAKQTFGSTVLILQGGSLFGLCHLGVIKALLEKNLLPRVISGTAIGAVVAGLICSLDDYDTDDELLINLTNITNFIESFEKKYTDVKNISVKYGDVLENVIKRGYSQDISIFMNFTKFKIGSLTFEEAYLKTGKILNILINPTDNNVPKLLNYVTTPNVLIVSAVYCSIGNELFRNEDICLLVKNQYNEIVEFETSLDCEFLPPQTEYNIKWKNLQLSNFHLGNLTKKDFEEEEAEEEEEEEVDEENEDYNDDDNDDVVKIDAKKDTSSEIKSTKITQRNKTEKTSKNIKEKTSTKKKAPRQRHHIEYRKSSNSSYIRLSELFNVNHFIVSLARPYLAPLVGNDLKHSSDWSIINNLKTILRLEFSHRIEFLEKCGFNINLIKKLAIDEKTPKTNSSEITIVPELRTLVKDFSRIFDINRYKENIPYWISVGEKSVWPLYPLIWTRTAIEFALDDYYNHNRHTHREKLYS